MDRISSKVLRIASNLECGELPKSVHITPVPKGGDCNQVGNFRPESVLSVVVKVFEKIVQRQLYTYLQQNDLLHPTQLGFRPGHSTQDVLVKVVDEWRKALDEDKVVGAVLLDPSKVFYMVDHTLLLKKMVHEIWSWWG